MIDKPITLKARLDTAPGGETFYRAHPQRDICPICAGNVSRTALVEVVYAFQECSCEVADFTHLYEQLWHRSCFIEEKGNPKVDAA